jgi:hypothetical protein
MPAMSSGRRRLLIGCSVIGGLLMALLMAEAALRVLGRFALLDYWSDRAPPAEPTTNVSDPVIGWKPLAGRYVVSAYWPGAADVAVTIQADGTRATAPSRSFAETMVLAIGDSLTLGWAISDQDTFLWRLQHRRPNLEFVNLGALGYSTWQAFLRSQEFIRASRRRPAHVIYQFVDDHELRNVGSLGWQLKLNQFARRGHVSVPYCLAGRLGGELDCRPPESFPRWPLDRYSFLVNFVKARYVRLADRGRLAQKERVTRALLERMSGWYRSIGAVFHVVFVWVDEGPRERYAAFLRDAGIPSANCVHPLREEPEMRVPGEGHPNAQMNAFLADCIEQHLRGYLLAPVLTQPR